MDDTSESIVNVVLQPKSGMIFETVDEAHKWYSRYAKQEGFSVTRSSTKNGVNGKMSYAVLCCSRGGSSRSKSVKTQPSVKIGCPARINLVLQKDGSWRLKHYIVEHNHEQSPSEVKNLKCDLAIDGHTNRRVEPNDEVGIKLNKTCNALQIEVGERIDVSFIQKDCQNYLDKQRLLKLVEGDAQAMNRYFTKMQMDNSDFFYSIDFDDEGRLRNVFWADARSRAATKEFGDVVTFDTTCLVNRYDMPLALFVGVNHHGQSILLGCGLLSNEDEESFSWLFQAWKTCMLDCSPVGIITDQCMTMKNAIATIFPQTRHRWCIWHILKKVAKKLSGYIAREKISECIQRVVYSSVTPEQFENDWKAFVEEYNLVDNLWLAGLFAERNMWVPAYLKDIFWAGVSSTQKLESMSTYFNGYITSKTTLKQFVEQYNNLLANKVEEEMLEDTKSWNSFIPLIQEHDELKKKIQSVYTYAKVKEFQQEIIGRLSCEISRKIEGDLVCEYEVIERVVFGEGKSIMRKEVAYKVEVNVESNETSCLCKLFEVRGMICRHQLLVWFTRRIQKVPDKYVLRRWSKIVKRAHSKVRIGYDRLSRGIQGQRYEEICNLSEEIAHLAKGSQTRFDLVMSKLREFQLEFIEESCVASKDCSPSRIDEIEMNDSDRILDPKGVYRKGSTRMQEVVEQIIKNKKLKKRDNSPSQPDADNIFPSQSSIAQEVAANFDSSTKNDDDFMEFDSWMRARNEQVKCCKVVEEMEIVVGAHSVLGCLVSGPKWNKTCSLE